jgi:hypothetical protein
LSAWLASLRVRNYERGQPDNRRTNKKNVEKRAKDYRAGVWMQTCCAIPQPGLMHTCIYFGFIWLFSHGDLEIDHQLTE